MSLLLGPFRAALTGRISGTTLLSSSVFQDKAAVPTSVFHAAGTPHLTPPMNHPQSFTALTNSTTASHPAPFMSSASKSSAEVSSSAQSTESSLSLPISLFPDAKHARSAVLPVGEFRSKTDFLFRNAAHSSPTSPRSPLLMETNEVFTGAARTVSPRVAAANQDRLQISPSAASESESCRNWTDGT